MQTWLTRPMFEDTDEFREWEKKQERAKFEKEQLEFGQTPEGRALAETQSQFMVGPQ